MGDEHNHLTRTLAEQSACKRTGDPAEAAMRVEERCASVETDHGSPLEWYCRDGLPPPSLLDERNRR